jgi:hypothetical protein
MTQKGRPKKIKTEETIVPAVIDHAKLLKQREQEQQIQLEELYKELSKIKHNINLALTQIGFIDSCDNLAEAAFKSGRAYGPLDEANDKLEEILEDIYNNNDVDHWDDIFDNF